MIPLRVHILTSKDLDLANARITDLEAAKLVPKINAIWSKAGIAFGLESVIREPAAQVERFRSIVAANNGQVADLAIFAYLIPPTNRSFDGLHVYVLGDLPFNGVYNAGAEASIVKDKPELNEVKGGTKDWVARVAAQGLGRAMGLNGRQDEVGLLSSGTNGVGLNDVEIGRARQVARTIAGILDVDDLAKVAETASKNKDIARARQLWTWLAEVPGTGPGAAQARTKLLGLPAKPWIAGRASPYPRERPRRTGGSASPPGRSVGPRDTLRRSR